MSVCPFINKTPSALNCANCSFYLYERQTNSTYCAIILAAERSVNAVEILTKNQ